MADMSDDLQSSCEALGKRIAASLGEKRGMNYRDAKHHYEFLLRADIEKGSLRGEVWKQRERADEAEAELDRLEADRDRIRDERNHLRERLAETDQGATILALEETIAAADKDRDRLEAERNRLAEQVKSVLDSAHWALATSADDWGATFGKAWLYGMFVGWGCEENHEHDEICGGDGVLEELAARGAWPPAAIERLRSLRSTIRDLDGEVASDAP